MKKETGGQLTLMAHHFATVLVVLSGLRSLCGDVEAQWGPWAALVMLSCLGQSWQAHRLHDLFGQRPRLIAAVTASCVAVMVVLLLATGSVPLSIPAAPPG